MEPDEALNLLDQAASLAPLNRATHIQIQNAIVILRELIKPKEVKQSLEPKKE